MVEAVDTSGRAVLFAGATVIISLLGLFIMGWRSCTVWPSVPSSAC